MEGSHAAGEGIQIVKEERMEQVSEYLKLLEESLSKKITILQALLEASQRQSDIADGEEFDLDAFEGTLDQKEGLLNQLEELDNGFERVFNQIQGEVKKDPPRYRAEIQKLQDLVRKCTDIGVELQAMEERNKAKLSVKFANQQRELRQIKTSSKVASTYYKSMTNKQPDDSYFMDQKK